MKDLDMANQEPILGGINLQLFADEGEGEGNNEETNTGNEDKGNEKDDKTFKQEDVNNIVARESKKAQEKLLKQLGIEDFENAREGYSKFLEWQEEQKTEQEKQSEQLETLANEKESLINENTSLKAQLSALNQGVNSESVEDVVTLAERLVSDDVTLDEAIKEIIEKYPQFAAREEEEEESYKPNFTTGQHQKDTSKDDAFERKLEKYK